MYRYLILTIVAILASSQAYAGWTEDTRIHDDWRIIHPQVVARNDTIHVLWERLSIDSVSYIRSTDGGETWDSYCVLSEDNHDAVYADLSLDENGLLVTWEDMNYDNNQNKIAVITSPDGSVWSAPQYVATDNPHNIINPASTVKGDSIFLLYKSQRVDSTGGKPIRFFYSYNYGIGWSDEVTIGYANYGDPQDLIIKYCNGALLVVWAGFIDTVHIDYHVVGYRSTDAGQTWSGTIWISPDIPYSAQLPCIACNEETGQIAVGYMDYRYQQHAFYGDIFIAISNDNGLSWPSEVMGSENHYGRFPSIEFMGDTLITAWSDGQFYDEGEQEILFNRSDDLGSSWMGELRLTNAVGLSTTPWLSMEDGKIHVVWREYDRNGSGANELYYRRFDPEPAAISNDLILKPTEFSIMAYPNPFNSNLSISINSEIPGTVIIYDILGRIIKEYSFAKGRSSLTWDGRDSNGTALSSGIYFIRTRALNGETSRKVVFLK